ncbi:hypothetical protein EKE94_15305 [Mesobaculum littorinae]|uniref:Uncharacterized protein n=1 Tax=Mesobaculum littorinae TaxID=2486419 RepID=A0A438AEA1_9RHOB|nr:hypothetical protein [Mesobaculum littorinae]RVV97030.1 hypothetical protein EKE94_15305 [Mesobaculum littorinae]
MTLLEDWIAYVEDPTLFDKFHFEGLMLELETPDALHNAFDRLPGGPRFADRVAELRASADFNGTYLLPQTKEIADEDYRLARAYRDHVADYLRGKGDPEAAANGRGEVKEIAHDEYRRRRKQKELGLSNVTWDIDGDFVAPLLALPRWSRGLYEATLAMTTIPEVTRFLLAPIVPYELDDRPAAELWLRGHRIDFTKDHDILLIVGGGG